MVFEEITVDIEEGKLRKGHNPGSGGPEQFAIGPTNSKSSLAAGIEFRSMGHFGTNVQVGSQMFSDIGTPLAMPPASKDAIDAASRGGQIRVDGDTYAKHLTSSPGVYIIGPEFHMALFLASTGRLSVGKRLESVSITEFQLSDFLVRTEPQAVLRAVG
ncbi:hypothetical protein MRS44_017092 [Fusarium solani]|uniref:uncharacterized protein n=1 Tax=Fusarium solani TaxID=169388 RepID=UPI0032C47380|nr:hypothetical protein MRS44_017092 [Fusarium solani]